MAEAEILLRECTMLKRKITKAGLTGALFIVSFQTGCMADGSPDWSMFEALTGIAANALEEDHPDRAAKLRKQNDLYRSLNRSQQIGKRD